MTQEPTNNESFARHKNGAEIHGGREVANEKRWNPFSVRISCSSYWELVPCWSSRSLVHVPPL